MSLNKELWLLHVEQIGSGRLVQDLTIEEFKKVKEFISEMKSQREKVSSPEDISTFRCVEEYVFKNN